MGFYFWFTFRFPFGFSQVDSINWIMPNKIVLEIVYVIVFTTFFAYLLNIYGLKKVSPTVASSFIYLQPILTSLIAVCLGRRNIGLAKNCIWNNNFFRSIHCFYSPKELSLRIFLIFVQKLIYDKIYDWLWKSRRCC